MTASRQARTLWPGESHAFAYMAQPRSEKSPRIVLTTANALTQKNAPSATLGAMAWNLAPGNRASMDTLAGWLAANGFERVSTVRERGEFAVRGGILDLFAPGRGEPVRLDFFGDTLETIRSFDPATQRTLAQVKRLELSPMSEVVLTPDTISRFRKAYVARFGAATRDDALYQAVSEGRRFTGMEHWLPLFHEHLEPVFHLFSDFHLAVDYHLEEAASARYEQVCDHYEARKAALGETPDGAPYKPVEPDTLYVSPREVAIALSGLQATVVSPFVPPDAAGRRIIDLEGRRGRSFATERSSGVNVFEAVANHAADERARGQAVVIASWTTGARDRMRQVLAEHGMDRTALVDNFAQVQNLEKGRTALAVLPMEEGFSLPGITFIAEQDILGDRLVRRTTRKRKAGDFIAEASALSEGDIVVHVEHGIGALRRAEDDHGGRRAA